MWNTEARIYLSRTEQARKARVYKVDVIEVYGGHAEITREALRVGLRALQPVDDVYGIHLRTKASYEQLRLLIKKHKPFLVIYEIECKLWSNIQYLNYDVETLKQLRRAQDLAISEMVKTIMEAHQEYGGHFLIENPAHTDFWKHPRLQPLLRVGELRVGHMCRFGLKDKSDTLLKKPTGWLSDLPRLLDQLALQCPGLDQHEHGQILGGDSAASQVYTPQLAKAVVRGLCDSLQEAGDERFAVPEPESTAWISHECSASSLEWLPPGELVSDFTVYFADVNRHESSWMPLLREAEEQLRNKVRPDKVMPISTPFGEQLKALVPWQVHRIQICRTPMQRRLPLEVLQGGATHRGAVLWLSDGSVSIEAEEVRQVLSQSANKFASPVRMAIFFFGVAPASSLNPTEDTKPEAAVATKPQTEIEENDMLKPHQPGFRDISFPGLQAAPKWLLQVMRRLHTNLGHPSTATMVRQLTSAGASDVAIQAARHLRCEVCLRVQPPREPRPAKPTLPRRFNDRLDLDVLWLKDIRGKTHGYLSQVDDATCYHVLNYLHNRSEEEVMKLLINGWFAFFGPPDEMLLDSDGSFRGYRFETLQAQCAVKVRYAPADAHYQMGRAERHGQAIKYIVQRLVSQFAPVGAQELNMLVTLAAAAKNNLMRRAGSSPAQWVYGRNHKIPGALLSSGGNVESCQLHTDSERLRHIEQVRTQSMMLYHQFESDNALRTALLRKPRPARGPFEIGQKIAYYRLRNSADGEGTLEGYRQGVVVAIDGSTLWIRNTRGRLISASKEQVRSVGGEEEWWTPSPEDLRLLKNADQDLSDKHSASAAAGPTLGPSTSTLAFRVPEGAVPSELSDLQAVDDLQLALNEPAPLPALDGAGRPLLDASGRPTPSTPAPPMLAPLQMVPATPKAPQTQRSAPGTPRPRSRPRSRTPSRVLDAVPETQALAPPEQTASPSEPKPLSSAEQRASPSEPQPLSSQPRASPSEPQPLTSEQRASSSEPRHSATELRTQSGASASASRQVSQDSSFPRHTSQGTSDLQRGLEQLMEQVSSQGSSRGTKRPPASSLESLDAPATATRRQPPVMSQETDAQALLNFCQECGEQHRVLLDGVSTCSRCSSTRTVSSPMHVLSWFDEVKEREAVEQHFEDYHMLTPGREAEPTSIPEDNEFTTFEATANAVCATFPKFHRPLQRLDVLRRHGRAEAYKVGWDGSPSEMQPYFVSNAYLTAAHYFGDHSSPQASLLLDGPDVGPSSSANLVATEKLPASEILAQQLCEHKDFKPETLHQLLDAVKIPKNNRNCFEGNGGGFLLGLYSHGGFSGLTNNTFTNKRLTGYLAQYFRHHGLQGNVTSFYVSRNGRATCHKDSNNLPGSLNWATSVGNYRGGHLWVECKDAKPPPGATYKNINGKKVPGFLVDTRNQVMAFRPECLHEVQPFEGERYSIVAFTSRSFQFCHQGIRRKLRKLGMVTSSTPCTSWQAVVDQWPLERPAWLDAPVSEAYPTRAWRPPADGETMAMDTSGEEGDDASGVEPPSRAQRQALKKELPWQAMSEQEVPQFIQAVLDEWSEWKKWSSCRPLYVDVNKIDPALILKSRVCFRWKPRGDGTFKPKARIVIAGYKDPHLPLLSRDSPVLSRAGLQCILQWATSLRVPLWTGDCKSAFLQGTADTERPTAIFMRAPADPVSKQAVEEWNHSGLLYKLSAPVYGQANAPRRWYLHVHQVLSKLGWQPHSLDPCLWLRREIVDGRLTVTAVLGVHVDDMLMACRDGYHHQLDDIHSSFVWGGDWESKDFVFVGRHITQHEDWSLTVDQASYVSEVPITKVAHSPEEKLSSHPDLITEFKSGIGSLQWLAGTSRGDISSDVSLLQKPPAELKVEDLLEVNSVLRYVRATNNACYKLVPIDFKDLILIAYGDSGWANAPGGKSQGGLVIAATHRAALSKPQPASLLEWKSFRHQRVLRSTLAAEAASLDRAEDSGNFLATMLSELIDGQFSSTTREVPLVEVVPVTDARSLWDAIHRLSTNFQEKRVEISIAALRQQCRGLRWVPTEVQVADSLTKRSRALRDRFRLWMGDPWITLVDSRSPDDITAPSQTNAAWR